MIKNPAHKQQLQSSGLTVIDFCDLDLLSTLQHIKNTSTVPPRSNQNYSLTHLSQSAQEAYHTSSLIEQAIGSYLPACFEEYTFYYAHFVTKVAYQGDAFALHQDWSIVDESKYKSIQIWLPLIDCAPQNGGLFYIEKSHMIGNHRRSGSIPSAQVPPLEELLPYIKSLALSKGQAAVFYNSTFHGSYANTAPQERIACIISLIPKAATPLYFYRNPTLQKICAYHMPTQFLLQHLNQLEKGELPENMTLISILEDEQPNSAPTTIQDIVTKIKNAP